MGTQTIIAKFIIDGGGDYQFPLKENQDRLYQILVGLFSYDQECNWRDAPYEYAETVNKNYSRIENRLL